MRPAPLSPLLPLLAAACLGGATAFWFVGRRATPATPPPALPRSAIVQSPAPAYDPLAAAELVRLRTEVSGLREQLDAARASLDLTSEALDHTAHELERLRRPLEVDMASATLRANLTPGEGVVTGGYRLPDGTRLFAFVETDTLPDGGIGLTSRFFSVPDDLTRQLGLETLATEAANTLQHGEVWVREELTDIANKLEKAPSARILSAGLATIQPGDPAPNQVPLAAKPGAPPLSLNVRAAYDSRHNLDLDLRVESVPPPEASPPPPAASETE